jgi:citrate synthase
MTQVLFPPASCNSEITYIDGGAGVLLHRGYPIEQLAENSNFLETCYLLLHGELPSPEVNDEFVNTIRYHTMVDEAIHQFFRGFPRTAHPMAMLCGVVGALSAFYHDDLDIDNPDHRLRAAYRVIAKMPTLAAMCYKHGVGQPFMYPQNEMGISRKFPAHDVRHALRATKSEPGAGQGYGYLIPAARRP